MKNNYFTITIIIYLTKKPIECIDDTWSVDILDLNVYATEKERVYRKYSVVIHNIRNFGWTVPSKFKNF